MRIVDLSIPIDTDTQVFPGDPVPAFAPASTLAVEGYNVQHVALGTHTGTHIDAPYHVRANGARVDELPIDRFVAPAAIVDLRGRRTNACSGHTQSGSHGSRRERAGPAACPRPGGRRRWHHRREPHRPGEH